MFKSYDMRGFGTYIRGIRKSLSYTQKDVESITGLSCESIRKIESGLVVPRYETLEYLSQAYKTDVLNVFSLFRSSQKLFDFYSYIDSIIVENNCDEISRLVDEFEMIICGETKSNLINITELTQLKLIISGIRSYYGSPSNDESLEYFLKAMLLSIPNFDLKNIQAFKYTQIEVRILLLLSLCLSQQKNYSKANKLLVTCLDNAHYSNKIEMKDRFMLIKIYFNLSYNYHCMDDNKKTLEYVTKGIDYCLDNHINYLLPGLLYRRGICKFNSSIEGHLDDLNDSVSLLKIMGNKKLADVYVKKAFEIYKIQL